MLGIGCSIQIWPIKYLWNKFNCPLVVHNISQWRFVYYQHQRLWHHPQTGSALNICKHTTRFLQFSIKSLHTHKNPESQIWWHLKAILESKNVIGKKYAIPWKNRLPMATSYSKIHFPFWHLTNRFTNLPFWTYTCTVQVQCCYSALLLWVF